MEAQPKIGLAQIDVIAGRPDINIKKVLECIDEAIDMELDVIALSEMVIPGYMNGDEWENDSFVRDCINYNEAILQASKRGKGICVIWGNVDADWTKVNEDGRVRKYNAAYICQNGKWISNGVFEGKTYKTLLPNYREFDDKRYFYSMYQLANSSAYEDVGEYLIPFKVDINGTEFNIGIMLCEDMWDQDYGVKPGKILKNNGAEIIINLSCSPWTWRKNDKRHRVAKELIYNIGLPMYYVNNVGTQNNGKNIYAFDGASTIYDEHGNVVAFEEPFFEGIITKETGVKFIEEPSKENDVKETFDILIYTIKKFFADKPKKVAIGLSGGIDSAVDAALLTIALGKENIYAVNMPSKFNSDTTKNAAIKLAEKLGINYCVIPIQESVDWTIKQVEGVGFQLNDLNRQNIQARDRGSRILAAVASAIGGFFVNNGNKSETCFGYATLYGDVNGCMSIIGDLYKTQVYDLAKYINKKFGESITIPNLYTSLLEEIISFVACAELSSDQNVDEGKGDPIIYEYHDPLVYQWVEGGYQKDYFPAYARRDPVDILKWYIDDTIDERLGLVYGTVKRIFKTDKAFVLDIEEKWNWYKKNVFKRIQSPPIIALSKRPFGFDLRESINSTYMVQEYQLLKNKLLDAS